MTDSPTTDHDEIDAEANAGLDLSPRTPLTAARRKPKRRWGAIAVLAVVVLVGAFVVTRFLGSALDYYCNADEVGVKSSCSGDRSLRVQGTVQKGSLVKLATQTVFVIGFNGVSLPVVYDGDPGGKFQECIPVVVRGRMKDGTFQGNELEVKHSNQYQAKNADRIAAAESSACPEAS